MDILSPADLSSKHRFNIPTILVVFGATGDLMRKKILPALHYLYQAESLPKSFQVVAYSRRAMSDEEYRSFVASSLETHADKVASDAFLNLFVYQQGDFETLSDYEKLGERLGKIDGMWKVCTNKLFYLSVPPQYYQEIFKHLSASHLTDPCSPEEGWTRVLVEKPFGDDLKTARQLDQLLAELFKEEQIYRIDHYLAKEMLQNILTFRFSNSLFERVWNNQAVESIEIRLLEKIGAEDRGEFYDNVGALRDVGQNHLLQMLALVTMEHPGSFDSAAVRAKRAQALEKLELLSPEAVASRSIRAQYEGFTGIKGVKPESQTETYFKVQMSLDSPRWAGVPVTLEAGKRMGQSLKEIVITFKEHQNKVTIQLEPKEGIFVQFWSKKPGFGMEIEERSLDFVLHSHEHQSQYVEEYAKLLIDAICGDQTLFVSTAEVNQMWQAIDPIVKAWQNGAVPLLSYVPDSADITSTPLTSQLDNQTTRKQVGIVGLGKMGGNAARRLMEKGWSVIGYNRSPDDTKSLEAEGLIGAYAPNELVNQLTGPRVVWLMLPAGQAIDDFLFGEAGIVPQLSPGDIVIDAGNSLYKDSIRRSAQLAEYQIKFVDVGFSGGPGGARNGACLMIGGDRASFQLLEPLYEDLAQPNGYQFFEGAGAGHFVKMIHNGIEYGMMQAIAEGFAIMKESDYNLNLTDVTKIYNNGSVIESRLTEWLQKAFEVRGEDLKEVSGTVKHTGEGQWTVEAANEIGVPAKIIESALQFRKLSEENPSYTGQILSALREQFGGHSIKG
jgi:glucose-6-phosphate 1-dehydrogenase